MARPIAMVNILLFSIHMLVDSRLTYMQKKQKKTTPYNQTDTQT